MILSIIAVIWIIWLYIHTYRKRKQQLGLATASDQEAIAIDEWVEQEKLPRVQQRPPRKFKQDAAKVSKPLPSPEDMDIVILYTTLTLTSAKLAYSLEKELSSLFREVSALNLADTDIDDLILTHSGAPRALVFVLPSYDTEVTPCSVFFNALKEIRDDFRVDAQPLQRSAAGFAIIGLGDREQWPKKQFCHQAIECSRLLRQLGGRKLLELEKVDAHGDLDFFRQQWVGRLRGKFGKTQLPDELSDHASTDDESSKVKLASNGLADVEDMGPIMLNARTSKEMVPQTSTTYRALTKQGYTIVGSHSGVKICRWTKSALRGRGSCYKFSFYGIRSHLCMETTPSLACANKCVFCWRHGTNPVATSWKWKVDPPEAILKGAMEGHYQKIKQMRGLPGLKQERFDEAMRIRHCALSLVGEPIFYPHINELVQMLHDREISSFLVCNAQHPTELRKLKPVTQLYVSVDAPTKSSLQKVDRPLHSDFWERTLECLDIIRDKKQRTVFRLTLVKAFNVEEVREYANLIQRGQPDFIEIKGNVSCFT